MVIYRIPGPIGRHPFPHRQYILGGAACPVQFDHATRRSKTREDETPIHLFGPFPKIDGETNTYTVSDYAIFFHADGNYSNGGVPQKRKKKRRSARSGSYEVIFVNGVQGNPAKHRAQACATASVSGGPVTGVYNMPGGPISDAISTVFTTLLGDTVGGFFGGLAVFVSDLLECATDKLSSSDGLKLQAWLHETFGSREQAEKAI